MSNTTNRTLLSLFLVVTAACSSGSSNKGESTAIVAQPEAPSADTLPKAEEILARAIEVTGGQAAYEAVKNYRIEGTFSIPAQKLEGSLNIVGATGGRMKTDIQIPGIGTERGGSDGTTVWSMSNMTGSRILQGPERERTLRDADLLKEVNWRDYYKSATTTSVQDVEGKPAFVVEMVDNSDISEIRFYDKDSGLLVRQTGTVKSQMGEMKNTMHLRDYKEFGGMLLPSRVEVEVMNMKQVMTTTKVDVNIEVPDETFALPDEIKTLVKSAK